jgi:hypothetical protein
MTYLVTPDGQIVPPGLPSNKLSSDRQLSMSNLIQAIEQTFPNLPLIKDNTQPHRYVQLQFQGLPAMNEIVIYPAGSKSFNVFLYTHNAKRETLITYATHDQVMACIDQHTILNSI